MRVVLAGGGVAAMETVLALRDLAGDRVSITVVAPEPQFEVKPMRVATPFSKGHVPRFDLAEALSPFDVELLRDALVAVDAPEHQVRLESGAHADYDALVLAVGAKPRAALPGVLTFGVEPLNPLLADLEGGYTSSVAFVVPPGAAWPLPIYELAMMTAGEVRSMGIDGVRVELVSPEPAPLAMFGADATAAIEDLLEEFGIVFRGRTIVEDPRSLGVDRVVALPVLDGPQIAGVPADERGFIPIDRHGRVQGIADVYAAGDGADFPIKQGGIACQQADAIAEELASRAGAPVRPKPYEPVLRGKLLTGAGAVYLRHDPHTGLGGGRASDHVLWWPPTKISGKYLSRWLERSEQPPPPDEPHVDVEVPVHNAFHEGLRAMALDPYSPVARP